MLEVHKCESPNMYAICNTIRLHIFINNIQGVQTRAISGCSAEMVSF